MTNAEKYKDAIMAQMCKTGRWAVNKANEIMSCDACSACLFRDGGYCPDERKKWLNTEADKKKAFSEKDKEVIRALDKVQWVVRDMFGTIEGYGIKPEKGARTWYDKYACTGDESAFVCLSSCSSATFTDIKWEDEEPTSREEILGEEK